MIGKLSGIVDAIDGAVVLLDVQGVGYLAACSARTLRRLPPVGQAAALLIETQLREDAINLYGFIDAAERDWFRLLITVQGVGARVALAILGALTLDELAAALAAQDKTILTRADGVGPKLASRLLVELKDKVPAGALALSRHGGAVASVAGVPATGDALSGDVVSALVNLGYRRADAYAVVTQLRARQPDVASFDALLRAALAQLAQGHAA